MKRISLLILSFFALCVCALAGEPTPPEKYEILIGEGAAGSGFVIQHASIFLGVMSIHQFEGDAPPSQLIALLGSPVLLDRNRIYKQKDVQALPVKSDPTKLQFLRYNSTFTLREGEELMILVLGDAVSASLTSKGLTGGQYSSSVGPRDLQATPSRPFRAAGGSGAPIIQKRNGAVIGVLLTADDGEKATVVGFETLCLPDNLNKKK